MSLTQAIIPILTLSEGRHKPVPGGLTAAVLAADTLGQVRMGLS
ncbi:hypothetical protein [Desulfomarina sp.]